MATISNKDILSMFGLTNKQTLILFSIEKLLIERDIAESKVHKEEKQKWLKTWTSAIMNSFNISQDAGISNLLSKDDIFTAIDQEDHVNTTWYYLIMLESTLFVPYTPLSDNKSENKNLKILKFNKQTEFLKDFASKSKIMDVTFIDRFEKTYAKSINRISEKNTKIALVIVSALAFAALTALTCGLAAAASAGEIAVAIFGSEFVCFGAALTSACLAMAGGGAIAASGGGVAAGIATIVGGGALIGFAGGAAVGGTVAGGSLHFILRAPQMALSQSAKLEVVLKEITLNIQKDIKLAQKVLENYKNQIAELTAQFAKIKLERSQDKKAISAMKESISYMEKAFKDLQRFVSSYGVAMGEFN
jgi:hypothetical protein